MNKEEARLSVMGAISMALKDPTLQQGFEIICKENEQLKADMATAIPLLEKAECSSCIYTDSPCVRGDFPFKENGRCSHYKHFGDEIQELKKQIEKMKCGQNCKFEYWINTGGCYDQKCRFTGLDCTNCKDKWKGKWEND